MTRQKKILFLIILLIILALVGLYFWNKAQAPTDQTVDQTDPTPSPVPVATPTPTPTPVQTPDPNPSTSSTGTLMGHTNLGASKINKIIIYNSTGKTVVASSTVDGSGDYSFSLPAGNYRIDYQASPDLYPHSPEAVEVKAGEIHEVDYSIEK